MASRCPLRLLPLLAAVAVLIPASGASAAGFTPGTPFPADATPWYSLEPQFMGDGTLLAAHTDVTSFTNPISSRVAVTRRPAGGGAWTEEFSLPSTPTNVPATPPFLAVAPSGAAVAAWLSLDNPDPGNVNTGERIQAAYRAPGGTWEAPATLATIPHNAGGGVEFAVAVAPDGKAYAFVGHYKTPLTSPPVEVIDQITHAAGGSWGAPVQVTPSTNSKNPVVGVDDAGAVTIAWDQQVLGTGTVTTSDDTYKIVASTRFASGLASLPADVFPGPTPWGAPVLGVGADGHAVIATQRQNAPTDVYAALGKEQNWSAPVHAVTGGASSAPLAAGVSPSGAAHVLYDFQGSNSGLNHIGLVRAAVGGPWSADQAVSPLGNQGNTGRLAFAGEDAVAAWATQTPGATKVGATRWAGTSATPDASVALETTTPNLDAVASDNLGNVAIFTDDGQQHQTLHAWDATQPALRGAQVPGTATALAPYHASTDASDLWSALVSPPTWTFDDGAPAVTATAIDHIFPTPGAHTLTVTVTDAAGNTGTTNFPVTVAKDAVAPTVAVTLPACKKGLSKKACAKLRAARSAWRTLTGTAGDAAPSSGLAKVQVGAYRKAGKRYQALVGTHFKTVSKATALKSTKAVTLAAGTWKLKLPATPARGTWTFTARATDTAGNASAVAKRTVKHL